MEKKQKKMKKLKIKEKKKKNKIKKIKKNVVVVVYGRNKYCHVIKVFLLKKKILVV
jgi:hypothetical protein